MSVETHQPALSPAGAQRCDAPSFRLLGPTEVHGVSGSVDLGAPQQRCVLVALLLEAGRVVPVDRLIDLVWPDDPPATARKAVQVYVSHLRRALADVPGAELVTVRPGYRMDADPADVDVHRFRALVRLAGASDAGVAAEVLAEALALWRGPVVADMVTSPIRESLGASLEEERLHAVEERAAAEISLGRAQAVVAELTGYVAVYPLRERGYRLLMRALYYCGRQAEALGVYQLARVTLGERLGTEPGPELRALHEQLLRGEMEPEADKAERIVHVLPGRARELSSRVDHGLGGDPLVVGGSATMDTCFPSHCYG